MSSPQRPRIWAARPGQSLAPRPPASPPALQPLGAVPPRPDAVGPRPPRRPGGLGAPVVAGTVAGVVTALAAVLVLTVTGVIGTRTVVQREAAPAAPAPRVEGSVVDIARRARPAIVTLTVGGGGRTASGSGVVFQSDGFVMTNHHVIEGSSSVTVELDTGRAYEGRVVGSDAETDIAVVKIEATDLTVATLGTATELEVGELAIAIGSPLGLTGGPSVTVGVISALGRTVEVREGKDLLDMIQTDAPISPGSSGGALLDARGAVVGVTTAIAVSEVGAEGLGFATPIDIARRVATQIIEAGEVVHPLIGIEGHTLVAERAVQLGLAGGAEVDSVQPGAPAATAGLRSGDIIVAFDGEPVASIEELIVGLRAHAPGDRITLEVVRGAERLTVRLELGRRGG